MDFSFFLGQGRLQQIYRFASEGSDQRGWPRQVFTTVLVGLVASRQADFNANNSHLGQGQSLRGKGICHFPQNLSGVIALVGKIANLGKLQTGKIHGARQKNEHIYWEVKKMNRFLNFRSSEAWRWRHQRSDWKNEVWFLSRILKPLAIDQFRGLE